MKNNISVKLSILLIRKIWHGKIGRGYNSKMNVECRFHPSCSNYGIKALEKHGFIKGWAKTLQRIYRCRPGYTGSKVDFP